MGYRDYSKQFKKKSSTMRLVLLAVIAMIAVSLSAVFLAQTTGENKGYRTISVIEVSGNVSAVKDGLEYRAYPGMLLQEGHELITSAESYVRLVLDDDKYVKIEAGSRVVFEKLGLLGSGKTHLRLERGALVTEIVNPLGEEEEFVVNTPNAVLAVRGTFFRVDLNQHNDGELKADVMTYGGLVASQRVLPTGEIVEEEVLIDAGYKAIINMTKDDTHYVVDLEDGDSVIVDPSDTEKPEDGTENIRPTQPITTDDISDEDLVDVYFAAENGHELFVTAEEVKKDLENREINIEEQKSVYEKAEEVKKEQAAEENATTTVANTTDVTVKADDKQPLVKVEEPKQEEEKNDNAIDTTPGTGGNAGNTGLIDGQHVHKEKRVTVAATCTEAGSVVVTCRDCKEIISKTVIPATGHTEVVGNAENVHSYCSICDVVLSTEHKIVHTVHKDPSCTEKGVDIYACDCGYSYTNETAAIGHTEVTGGTKEAHSKCSTCNEVLVAEHKLENTEHKTASCTENGMDAYVCDCGYTYTDVVKAKGHTEVKGATADVHSYCSICHVVLSTKHVMENTEYKAPSCTEKGVDTYACACGYTYSNEIAALGHTEVNGGFYDRHKVCSICQEVTDANHVFTDEYIAPTCKDIGLINHYCDCGYAYSDIIDEKAPHEYEEDFHLDVAPGCETPGSESRHCKVCNEKTDVREVPATGHSPVDGQLENVHSICEICNTVLSTEHTYTETDRQAATCAEEGYVNYVCSCGYEKTEILSKEEHDWGDWEVLIEATCEDIGFLVRYCKNNCRTEQQDTIPALGHEYTAFRETVAATCTTDGMQVKTCTHNECLSVIEEVIPAFGHSPVDGQLEDVHSICDICDTVLSTEHTMTQTGYVAPGCTTPGSETFACDCGYSYTNEVAAVGHNEVYGGVEEAHTKCSNCGEIFSAEHSFTDVFVKKATCTESGETFHHCVCEYEYTSYPAAKGHNYIAKEETGDDGFTTTYEECERCDDIINEYTYIALDATHFPDDKLLWFLSQAQYDVDGNSKLSVDEITAITTLDLSGEGSEGQVTTDGGYTNLDGIGYLTALETLDVSYNAGLTGLYLNSNPGIQTVVASGCNITSVLTTGCTQLDTLTIDYCSNLSIVDISSCVNLQELNAYNSGIVSINPAASGNYGLKRLDIRGTSISGLDFSMFSNVEVLKVDAELVDLDLGECQQLTDLHIGAGTVLYSINVSNKALLRNIVFEGATEIREIVATDLSLNSTIDFSKCPELNILDLSRTSISEIDLSQNDELTSLTLTGSSSIAMLDISNKANLTALNLTDCSSLQLLYVSGTPIETLDLSGCMMLSELDASACTSLAMVDLSDCNALSSVNLSGTPLTMMSTVQSDGVIVVPQPTTPTMIYLNLSNTNMNFSNCSVDKYTWWGAIETLILSNTNLNDTDWNKINENPLPQSLKVLDLANNSITQLDLSGRVALTQLNIEGCDQLVSLNVGGTGLEGLDISNAALSTLNVSNSGLYALYIINADITELELHNMTNLEQVYVEQAPLTTVTIQNTLISDSLVLNDISTLESVVATDSTINMASIEGCSSLHTLNMAGTNAEDVSFFNSTNIETLDLSGTKMTAFALDGTKYTKIATLTLSNCPDLASLSVTDCTALTLLDVRGSDSIRTLFDITGAGSATQPQSFTLITTEADTYYTVDITGWDSLYMGMTTSP